jgi:hypothetical protein
VNELQVGNLRRRTAELSVGASTVRRAGRNGSGSSARATAGSAQGLRRLIALSLLAALDRETVRIQRQLPDGARHWGVARKVLNIFLRSCVYSRPLASAYGLAHIDRWLELPLDSQVAEGIVMCSGAKLPRWRTVKAVSRRIHAEY